MCDNDDSQRDSSQHANKRRRTARATTSQIESLIAHIERQPFLATRKFTGLQGRENYTTAWETVVEDLNSMEKGSIKSTDQWITVWRDIKSRVCTKAAKLHKERKETGNRGVNTPPLTELEKRIVSIVGLDYSVGTNCPDSMPENDMDQVELEIIEEVPVEMQELPTSEYETIDIATAVPVTHTITSATYNVENSPPTYEIIMTTTTTSTHSTSRASTSRAAVTNTVTVNRVRTSAEQTQPRRNRNLNPRRSVAEQHSSARADFLAVAESNAASMRMLAAAAQQNAEAAKIQAEAAKMQAEASLSFAQAANTIADAISLFIDKNN